MEAQECKGFVVCCVGREGELVLVFHKGTGVLDPPFFPTKMALLKRYLRTKEDEEEEEQPRFLVLLWFCVRPSLRLRWLLVLV